MPRTQRQQTAASSEEPQSGTVQDMVKYLRAARDTLRARWVEQMRESGLTEGLSPEEVENESIAIYDTCVQCIETGDFGPAKDYAARMAQRGVLQGMTTDHLIGGLLALRDVYGRSLFERYRDDLPRLEAALNAYEPVANRILVIVAMTFIQEREQVVAQQQQQSIRELSTPVLQLREDLLILPIVGVLDSARARQLTEQLLESIRANRAKVVVLDITGVPAVDSKVANHLLQTIDASRLMGARVIVTGVAPEIAQILVTLGVDLTRLDALSDLQRGIEKAEEVTGYVVTREEASRPT